LAFNPRLILFKISNRIQNEIIYLILIYVIKIFDLKILLIN